MNQINTQEYWNKKWSDKKHGGKWGEKGYHFLKDILPKDEPFDLLDIGCGRGAGIFYLNELFSKGFYYGIDFSDKSIEIAKQKMNGMYNVFFQHSDAYKFDSYEYDYIIMVELLEHLRWPEKILEKYIPLVKKAIYISIPVTNWECDEHIYAYGTAKNPFEKYGAEIIGNIDGRKKLIIRSK